MTSNQLEIAAPEVCKRPVQARQRQQRRLAEVVRPRGSCSRELAATHSRREAVRSGALTRADGDLRPPTDASACSAFHALDGLPCLVDVFPSPISNKTIDVSSMCLVFRVIRVNRIKKSPRVIVRIAHEATSEPAAHRAESVGSEGGLVTLCLHTARPLAHACLCVHGPLSDNERRNT
jgi:hypothetical protein